MTPESTLLTCDGRLFKRLVEAGLAWLESNQEKVNQLNVFPVPDGDTGTNMTLTMQKAYDQVAGLDDAHIGNVSTAAAYGARLGARGNSGVILSEWWRGFAEALKDESVFDSMLFASACKRGVERAYAGTLEPVEGTILTVMRQAMETVNEQAVNVHDLHALFEMNVNAAYEALRQTPNLLPILMDAGVVDSGGQGWTFIMEGMLRHLRGEETRLFSAQTAQNAGEKSGWQEALVPEDEQGYGYDVQFLMRGEKLNVEVVRAAIAAIGWSTLVVGDDNLIKVHVHVHDPGVPLSYAIQQGAALDDVVVENMQQQYQAYVDQRTAREAQATGVSGIAVIAVAAGEGFRQLFLRDLGAADVILGGQTMNPSTDDFLKVIQTLPNIEIILLPNNPNGIMAAGQAATLAEGKNVQVVPSRSIPQGIAAMLAYEADEPLVQVRASMQEAMQDVITAEVTTATRDASLNGVSARAGQLIGLLDDKLAAADDDMQMLVKALLQKAGADKRELITLYYGESMDAAAAQHLSNFLAETFSKQEFQLVSGGQPLYPYIISVE